MNTLSCSTRRSSNRDIRHDEAVGDLRFSGPEQRESTSLRHHFTDGSCGKFKGSRGQPPAMHERASRRSAKPRSGSARQRGRSGEADRRSVLRNALPAEEPCRAQTWPGVARTAPPNHSGHQTLFRVILRLLRSKWPASLFSRATAKGDDDHPILAEPAHTPQTIATAVVMLPPTL